nr:G-type lectin S-receptor-like serine/threonine-protein kinase SD2-5 [Ipomoea batatas]
MSPDGEYYIANSSSTVSWTNNDYSFALNFSNGVQLPTVILYRESSEGEFACGVICDDLGTTCLFGVIIHYYYQDIVDLVWSGNWNHPVTANATVELNRDGGGLSLMDSDGSLVWSTHQTNSNNGTNPLVVYGLNLTENGNLVILGQKNETIWQSFHDPANTILP